MWLPCGCRLRVQRIQQQRQCTYRLQGVRLKDFGVHAQPVHGLGTRVEILGWACPGEIPCTHRSAVAGWGGGRKGEVNMEGRLWKSPCMQQGQGREAACMQRAHLWGAHGAERVHMRQLYTRRWRQEGGRNFSRRVVRQGKGNISISCLDPHPP